MWIPYFIGQIVDALHGGHNEDPKEKKGRECLVNGGDEERLPNSRTVVLGFRLLLCEDITCRSENPTSRATTTSFSNNLC